MLTRFTNGSISWIDIEKPNSEEIQNLTKEYAIHPLVAKELLSPTWRGRVDSYDNLIYLILYFPKIYETGARAGQEIDFVIGKNFMITAHYESIPPLTEFAAMFEAGAILGNLPNGHHAGFLFYHLLRHLYGRTEDELDELSADLAEIEKHIFGGEEHEMVQTISEIGRKFINFKKALRPHREMLESFEEAGIEFFGHDFSYNLRQLLGEYYKMYGTVETNIEILHELRETNKSLLSTKTSDIMKFLTVIAFIMLPLSFVTGLFGMNVEHIPIVGRPDDFWIVIGIIFTVALTLLLFVKYKKWM